MRGFTTRDELFEAQEHSLSDEQQLLHAHLQSTEVAQAMVDCIDAGLGEQLAAAVDGLP